MKFFAATWQTAKGNGYKIGKLDGMRATIDRAGRIVLPKAIHDVAHIEGGTEVEVRFAGDHLEIEPVPADLSFVRKGKFVVAVPNRTPENKLAAEVMEETRSLITLEREGETRKS